MSPGLPSTLASRGRSFASAHPILVQAARWSIPAVCLGFVLRALLLSYSPYAYWGSDSWSYFSFGYKFLTTLDISLNDKRRYLYPIFLLPVSALPGSPLQWLGWIQHLAGLATIVPLAYVVRRVFVAWKLVIIPVTLLWAGLPLMIWYEHELLAEAAFFGAVVFAIAGWVAWTVQTNPARARRLFWIFFAALALVVLTKPAGRFLWPGLLIGLVFLRSWRVLHWRHGVALLLLFGATLTVGQDKQGAWLLYSSSFALTRLDTPLHAEYKAEIRDLVEKHRADLLHYHARDRDIKNLLKRPGEYPDRPRWAALADQPEKQTELYEDLALEGIRHQPHWLLLISLTRALDSANQTQFNTARFGATYFADRIEEHYADWEKKGETALPKFIFGLDRGEPLPPLSELQSLIAPHPGAPQARWLRNYADRFAEAATVMQAPEDEDTNALPRPTLLGWWMAGGVLLSLAPFYWRTLAPWSVILGGYLAGVFLVGSANPRFFGVVLPFMALLLVLPVDVLWRMILRRKKPV